MKNYLNSYFSFTKREYNGLLALMFIIMLLSFIPYLYETFSPDSDEFTTTEQQAIRQLTLINKVEETQAIHRRSRANAIAIKPQLFKFDPNQISVQQWQKLGLSAKQANAIINYRNKGGKFREAADLQRMYTVSPEMYKRLQPYIQIEEVKTSRKPAVAEKLSLEKKRILIEINRADTIMLDEVKGIGPAFARRIVKYRERLGGFYKKEQLMEIYGLDSLKYQEIKDQVWIDASAITKIDLNTASFETLKNHPYLKYKQINAIIQYRKQHGNYKQVNDLKKVLILTPKTIELMTPYFKF